jgi:hypothetical protein
VLTRAESSEGVRRNGEFTESCEECVSLGVKSGGGLMSPILRGGGGRYSAERVGVETVCVNPALSSMEHREVGDRLAGREVGELVARMMGLEEVPRPLSLSVGCAR